MSMTRRALIGTGLATASAAALAGCGDSNTSPNTSSEIGGEIRFTFWYGPNDIAMWKSIGEDFMKLHPGVTVKQEPIGYADYWTKLNTQFAGGNAADVIMMQFQQSTMGPAGQLADLSTGVADDLDKIPEFLTKIGQTDVDGTTRQYALPWHFVGASLYTNMTALEDAGITPNSAWSLDDFVAAAKELTGDKVWGTTTPGGSMQTSIASTFGATPVSDDGKTATFDTDAMIAHKTFLRDLVHVHQVAPAPGVLSDQADPFASGQVRMFYAGSWNTPTYRTSVTKFDWDILTNPTGQQAPKNYAGPDMISMYAKSKNAATALAFIKYVVFDRAAQEPIAATGAPVLIDYLNDEKRVAEEVTLKPKNYKYFVEQITNNGAGWGFVPKFADIGKLEGDADYEIMSSATSDIPTILKDLNEKVQKALDSTK